VVKENPCRELLVVDEGDCHTSLREVRFSLARMCLDSTTSQGSSIFTLVKISEDRMEGNAMAWREIVPSREALRSHPGWLHAHTSLGSLLPVSYVPGWHYKPWILNFHACENLG
jgi:hypothetical protein